MASNDSRDNLSAGVSSSAPSSIWPAEKFYGSAKEASESNRFIRSVKMTNVFRKANKIHAPEERASAHLNIAKGVAEGSKPTQNASSAYEALENAFVSSATSHRTYFDQMQQIAETFAHVDRKTGAAKTRTLRQAEIAKFTQQISQCKTIADNKKLNFDVRLKAVENAKDVGERFFGKEIDAGIIAERASLTLRNGLIQEREAYFHDLLIQEKKEYLHNGKKINLTSVIRNPLPGQLQEMPTLPKLSTPAPSDGKGGVSFGLPISPPPTRPLPVPPGKKLYDSALSAGKQLIDPSTRIGKIAKDNHQTAFENAWKFADKYLQFDAHAKVKDSARQTVDLYANVYAQFNDANKEKYAPKMIAAVDTAQRLHESDQLRHSPVSDKATEAKEEATRREFDYKINHINDVSEKGDFSAKREAFQEAGALIDKKYADVVPEWTDRTGDVVADLYKTLRTHPSAGRNLKVQTEIARDLHGHMDAMGDVVVEVAKEIKLLSLNVAKKKSGQEAENNLRKVRNDSTLQKEAREVADVLRASGVSESIGVADNLNALAGNSDKREMELLQDDVNAINELASKEKGKAEKTAKASFERAEKLSLSSLGEERAYRMAQLFEQQDEKTQQKSAIKMLGVAGSLKEAEVSELKKTEHRFEAVKQTGINASIMVGLSIERGETFPDNADRPIRKETLLENADRPIRKETLLENADRLVNSFDDAFAITKKEKAEQAEYVKTTVAKEKQVAAGLMDEISKLNDAYQPGQDISVKAEEIFQKAQNAAGYAHTRNEGVSAMAEIYTGQGNEAQGKTAKAMVGVALSMNASKELPKNERGISESGEYAGMAASVHVALEVRRNPKAEKNNDLINRFDNSFFGSSPEKSKLEKSKRDRQVDIIVQREQGMAKDLLSQIEQLNRNSGLDQDISAQATQIFAKGSEFSASAFTQNQGVEAMSKTFSVQSEQKQQETADIMVKAAIAASDEAYFKDSNNKYDDIRNAGMAATREAQINIARNEVSANSSKELIQAFDKAFNVTRDEQRQRSEDVATAIQRDKILREKARAEKVPQFALQRAMQRRGLQSSQPQKESAPQQRETAAPPSSKKKKFPPALPSARFAQKMQGAEKSPLDTISERANPENRISWVERINNDMKPLPKLPVDRTSQEVKGAHTAQLAFEKSAALSSSQEKGEGLA